MRAQPGMALVLTLWVLAVLIILAGTLTISVRSDIHIARNFGDLERCRWAAYAGQQCAMSEVATLTQQPYLYFTDGVETLTSDDAGVDLNEASFTVTISDEAGKVNINTAPHDTLSALFGSDDIADAIIDWRDADSTISPQGAEDDYYLGLTPPYHCKNAPFTTVNELLLVKGITADMLAAQVDDSHTLRELLTVYSTDANTAVDGSARVYIATASNSTLQTAFGDVLSTQDITAIINYRNANRFQHAADIVLVSSLSRDKVRAIYDRLTVASASVQTGLVNINTAPLAVLAVLPGFDQASAQTIVDYRDANGAFSTVGDLLNITGIDNEVFANVADSLTVRSRTFQVAATGQVQAVKTSSTMTSVLNVDAQNSVGTLFWRE